MTWRTKQYSIDNLEIYSSDINLNTDNLESDVLLVRSDLVVLSSAATSSIAYLSDIQSDMVVHEAILTTIDTSADNIEAYTSDMRSDLLLHKALLTTIDTSADNIEASISDIALAVHAEDTAHVTGDKGVQMLTVRKDDVAAISGDDGDYQSLVTNENGILRTQAQQHRDIDDFDATTGWAGQNDATSDVTSDANHAFGTQSLSFNKIDGSGFTSAIVEKTITSVDVSPYHKGGGLYVMSMYVSDTAEVDYAFLRLGTDSDNYNEWQVDADALDSGEWNSITFPIAAPKFSANTGTGCDTTAITYAAVGIEMDAEGDELRGILVDHLAINTGLRVTTSIDTEVTSVVNTANVNLLKVGNKVVDKDAGAVGDGTQRVTLGSDDPAVASLDNVEAYTSDMRSDLLLHKALLTAVQSDMVLHEALLTAVQSDLVVIDDVLDAIVVDTTNIETYTSDIRSDLLLHKAILTTINAALDPAGQTALSDWGVTSDWDANTEVSITAGAHFLHVYTSDNAMRLICDTTTSDPTVNCAIYTADTTHVIPCKGQTKLHYKTPNAGETGRISVTAHHD